MTNLLNLPQIPAGTTITIAHNVDWDDQIFVTQPGFSGTVSVSGTLTASSESVSGIASTAGLAPGMVAVGYGIPVGTTITAVGTSTITLSNDATVSATLDITCYPPPLDLTGISFVSELRQNTTTSNLLISMSTANGLMVNGGTTGQFGWAVPAAKLPNWPAPLSGQGTLACVLDIQATDSSGALVNLCDANGPIPVTVNLAVTR
jgi:hypothetical protein